MPPMRPATAVSRGPTRPTPRPTRRGERAASRGGTRVTPTAPIRPTRILESRLRTDWTMELTAGRAPSMARRTFTVERTSLRSSLTSSRMVWNSPLVVTIPAWLVTWLRMPASWSRRSWRSSFAFSPPCSLVISPDLTPARVESTSKRH